MADAFDADFISISAVLGGIKEIREAVERAQLSREGLTPRRTLVFVDEVHRFNKSQQDAFLPHVESGLFTFIGATTENPSFEVNSALLSRAAVYVLQALGEEALAQLIAKARALDAVPALDDAAAYRCAAEAGPAGAWFELATDKGPVRVKALLSQAEAGEGEPGEVLDQALLVATGSGALRLLRVQREGKGAQDAEVFLRGTAVAPGTRFL
jgi:hypothetical protein